MSHAVEDASLSPFHKRLALLSSGGPFLDGYILSVIGVAMVQLTPELGLSANEQGLAGAAALVGLFFGAFSTRMRTARFVVEVVGDRDDCTHPA